MIHPKAFSFFFFRSPFRTVTMFFVL